MRSLVLCALVALIFATPAAAQCPSGMEPGTIAVIQHKQKLCFMEDNGAVSVFDVATGRDGFTWTGVQHVSNKKEWPDWTPTPAMLKRDKYLPPFMAGGPGNPLGAAALYLGSTEYRIHGTNSKSSIGHAISSGCIRMRNEDIRILYNKVRTSTKWQSGTKVTMYK